MNAKNNQGIFVEIIETETEEKFENWNVNLLNFFDRNFKSY